MKRIIEAAVPPKKVFRTDEARIKASRRVEEWLKGSKLEGKVNVFSKDGWTYEIQWTFHKDDYNEITIKAHEIKGDKEDRVCFFAWAEDEFVVTGSGENLINLLCSMKRELIGGQGDEWEQVKEIDKFSFSLALNAFHTTQRMGEYKRGYFGWEEVNGSKTIRPYKVGMIDKSGEFPFVEYTVICFSKQREAYERKVIKQVREDFEKVKESLNRAGWICS